MINEKIAKSMLEEFDGCDCESPGSPESPSVWLFGIEWGRPEKQQEPEVAGKPIVNEPVDTDYSVKTQLGYPYNLKAFKLLAAMNGYEVNQYYEFAKDHQPFVKGSEGYFKGNLYPYACKNVNEWPDDVKNEIGVSSKEEYRQWCREHRLPVVKQWVDKYQPKIFIGVGITCRDEFSLAVFGKQVEFQIETIADNTLSRPIYYFTEGARKLVVIPHFSGRYGLRSNELLRMAGEFVAKLLSAGRDKCPSITASNT